MFVTVHHLVDIPAEQSLFLSPFIPASFVYVFFFPHPLFERLFHEKNQSPNIKMFNDWFGGALFLPARLCRYAVCKPDKSLCIKFPLVAPPLTNRDGMPCDLG